MYKVNGGIYMSKYKDPCDKCGKFDYLKGYEDGKCYCPECLKQIQEEKEKNDKESKS